MNQKLKMKNRFFILIITLICGLLSFSQDITIVGGTVKCPAPLGVGYSKTIAGKTYYVVDSAAISQILITGSFSVGASTVTPNDLSCVCTTQITSMEDMFNGQATFNDDISNWDTSNVTNMQQMFMGTASFTININSWVVSSVTDMDGMFRAATSFNQPLNNWNVGNVNSMSNMFRDASAFDQPLDNWNVSNVKYMQYLFRGASAFDQPLNNWNVIKVLDMSQMFYEASVFDQDLNNWNVSKVRNMTHMFSRAHNFNGDITNWVTSSLTNLTYTFNAANAFNRDLSGWNTSSVTRMKGTFKNAWVFNQDLSGWDTSSVNTMEDMFYRASAFNNDGSAFTSWVVSNVTNMHEMFKEARVFDRDISGWTTTSLEDISGMFFDALEFNQNLNSWNVSSVTDMNNTFRNADKFNQPLNNWDTSNVKYMVGTFRDNGIFNQDLTSWVTSSVEDMRWTFMNNPVFNNGQSSGVSNTLQWDTSTVTRMDNMFAVASAFNGNISGWNVSGVTQMYRMFFNASVFNQDLSNWNTSSAITLQGMFNGATIFNNGLSAGVSSTIMNWNTSSVTTIESTFASAPAFNGNISGWDVSNVTTANNLFNTTPNFNHPLGGWDVTSINSMNNMFAGASSFDQDLNCWCVVHNPSRSSFSNSSPIDSKLLFLPRWAEPCDPSISFSATVISQDDSPISPTIVSSGGTFTASITGGIVHRVNQWGSGRADFLDINATTGEINPSTSLAGVYEITYSTGACKSFTTTITIRSINNPLNQLSYTSSSVCKSIGGTLSPTIIPTNSHATVPRIYIDPGNPISYPNLGNAPNGETIVNLTTNSGFTHWEDGVVADVSGNHPNYMIVSDNNGVVHKPGYSWELLPGATEDNFITDLGGDRSYFPRESSSISMWVKESNWSNTTFLFDYTNGNDTSGKMWLASINPSGELRWRIKTGTISQVDNVNSMTNNNWHHIVFTRDESGNPGGGGIVKLYIDGVLSSINYGTPTGALATPGDVIFGRNQQTQSGVNGLGKFTGEFGPIRIFAHELTQSEIEYEYDMFALRYKPDSFTATPAGLSINATTGIIDVSNSSGGVYQVTASWTEPTSGKVHTATNTIIIKDPDASFSYSDNYFCQGSGGFADPSVITTGGSFTASPSTGLIIDSVSGRITPGISTPGNYIIEHGLECSATSTLSIEIVAPEAPLVTYTSYDSCKNVDPSISFTPTLSIPGGSFTSSPPGLDLNSVSGKIIPNSSQTGTYTINYTTTGRCPGEVGVSFVIYPLGNSTFNYSKSFYSKTISSIITPTINTIGGTFSSSPTGLDINTSNGAINPSLSDLGIYTILYNQGLCSSVSSSVIEIKTLNVILTDSDADNIVSPLDTITVTATFSEPVQSAPKVNFSGAGPNNIDMTATGSSSVWTYIFDFQSFSILPSLYTLTVSATDLEGNPYVGDDNIVFDYQLLDPNLSLSDIIKNFNDPDFILSATTSSSSDLSYAIADSSVAIVSGSSVSISGAGSTIITVNQVLSGFYKAATATATLTVNKIGPTIISEIVTKTYGDPDFSVSAISSSTGTFSYEVMDTSIASNTGFNLITITGVGTTTIKITQTADINFSTGSKTIILYVRKADPTIIISNIVTKTYGDPDFNLTATSSSTGLFSYNALNKAVASISSITVSIAGAGTSTIIVNQGSDGLYNAGSTSLTLIVLKADPIIHFPDVIKTYGDPDFTITATSSSTGDFGYSIDNLRIASPVSLVGIPTSTINSITARGSSSRSPISSLFITIAKAGSTSIAAVQAEDTNYKSTTASATLTILKKDLDSSVWYPTSIISRTFGIPPFEIVLPNVDSNYNGVFNFRSSDPSIVSVSSRTITINSVGTVTLFADLSSDENYNAKTVIVTLVVKKANQSIIVEPFDLVKPLKDFSSFTVSATSTSGAPVIISLAPGSAASLSGTVGNHSLTNINQTGLVTITFTTESSAHPNYNPATLIMVIDVVKTNQNITISPKPLEFLYYEENLTYQINAISDSSLNLAYRIISGVNAILNADTLEISDIGELEIEISQPGNNSFNPAVSRSFIIKVLQGITILSNFNIPEKLIIDDDFTITPPTSNRSGPIKYISSNSNIAEIVGDQIIVKGIGSCTISAIQLATPQYKSASISTIFTVNDTDCDSDGIGDTIDEDDDNDGISDIQELLNGTNPCALDTDNDFLGDGDENEIGTDPLDNDTDNDGVLDGLDDFPLDPNESVDTDGDGIGDNSDDDLNGDGFSDDEIFVSGLLTPGVRGNEATWKVMNIQSYPGSKVSIYDRNGLQVFKKINYQNDWAGTFQQNGELLPAGSYYYRIEMTDENKVLQGWLYLTY